MSFHGGGYKTYQPCASSAFVTLYSNMNTSCCTLDTYSIDCILILQLRVALHIVSIMRPAAEMRVAKTFAAVSA